MCDTHKGTESRVLPHPLQTLQNFLGVMVSAFLKPLFLVLNPIKLGVLVPFTGTVHKDTLVVPLFINAFPNLNARVL